VKREEKGRERGKRCLQLFEKKECLLLIRNNGGNISRKRSIGRRKKRKGKVHQFT